MKLPLTRRALTATLSLLVVSGAGVFCFLNIGSWLVVSNPLPAKLDYIFTFAGENPRLVYSRELMERYPDAHWILSDFHHYYSRILKRNGFEMKRVSPIDTASHTFAEVHALADWLRTHPADSSLPHGGVTGDSVDQSAPLAVGLVSSPHHMRRISFMVNDVFHSRHDLVFYYLPVPYERFKWSDRDVREWWRKETIRNFVGSELGKLVVYWLIS